MKQQPIFYIKDFGCTDFLGLWNIQKQILNLKIKFLNKKYNFLLVLEHNNVYTFGTSTKCSNFFRFSNNKTFKKIKIFKVDRGGKVTSHGPGQLVIYFILDLFLFNYDFNLYLRFLENIIIITLLKNQIFAFRIINKSGIWVRNYNLFYKIGFIGIKIINYITKHGLALNINPDLNIFFSILTCGINNKNYCVTSIEKETEKSIKKKSFKKNLKNELCFFFNFLKF
ncbi:lipoyl(octanoyl) transferase LipB [Candidatus Karelsulcia muelleri]|uniref:lipoyl(octanoyl) transferase LipB n=1 Tax=Candidatus Karelsulcia muelleri TaxID=336810 RepID=UPI00236394D3|nr:lipoyl(octanoyl) transferase LipB [Candidatus Karelsulcia muelleri]WDE42280.1 lipoyl(octanoyl) transferase LipB [Candidatus Karelsulcia muelleri]WDR79129.1 lipoyl(octanoyl) transferase LipB [Candidatus Karelsulcia muelleri]